MKRLLGTLFIFALLAIVAACTPQTNTISMLQAQEEATLTGSHPTLEDYWEGRAEFKITVPDTGLPMGESETIMMDNGHLWSFVHASDRSAGTIDQCGDPVEFPGCTVIYYSTDDGDTFRPEQTPICQFSCTQCPCDSFVDHIDQQQYPDLHMFGTTLFSVYEYRGSTQMRISTDGHQWTPPQHVGGSGHYQIGDVPCPDEQRIGEHPFVPYDYDCLAGGPPGVYVEDGVVYVLVAMGQNPGNMGCIKGAVGTDPSTYLPCDNNPLFTGAKEYGPLELRGTEANPYWDFRTISSAEMYPIGEGEDRRYYMFFEGLRGPGPFDPGDTQFGLGLARSLTSEVDGPWEKFHGNPILVDLPSNIGIGHADVIVLDGKTVLYTSLDGVTRSRLDLIWGEGGRELREQEVAPFQDDEVSVHNGTIPTLLDYWEGRAEFTLEVPTTGLPLGESETVIKPNGEWWSYLHASDQSAGVIDQCGDPVAFPGCTVIYRSYDDGVTFAPGSNPVCQFECQQCPCDSVIDHVDQQQYPDVHWTEDMLFLVYEYRGNSKMRTSEDGLNWSPPSHVAESGHWRTDFRPCPPAEVIGQHPFVPYDYECLAGAPPGMYIEGDTVYVFIANGQNPGRMGCFKGSVDEDPSLYQRCENNPLFTGALEYGPAALGGAAANPYFDFRTISSAEIVPLDTPEGRRYYMFFEGIRGPGPGDPGDTQFGLGVARSLTDQLDGPWEKFSGNPILLDVPANVGLGHADIVIHEGETYLYTSLDYATRSRLKLTWKTPNQ